MRATCSLIDAQNSDRVAMSQEQQVQQQPAAPSVAVAKRVDGDIWSKGMKSPQPSESSGEVFACDMNRHRSSLSLSLSPTQKASTILVPTEIQKSVSSITLHYSNNFSLFLFILCPISRSCRIMKACLLKLLSPNNARAAENH